jgi:hydroxymethylpyrimidine/phosphomethylpyrimidine kinase
MSHSAAPIKCALTIAGSDGSGGAGIQADLKTFHALGVYGLSAITAVTVQNTQKVRAVQSIDPQIVYDQIVCLFDDIPVSAVKIGMIPNTEVMEAVALALKKAQAPLVVLDPVMISTSGYDLLKPTARQALVTKLFPLAEVVTPNIHEAEALLGTVITTMTQMEQAAERIARLGASQVIVKGGHLAGDQAVDVLYDGRSFHHLSAPRLDTPHTHGTGCTFSAAIAAFSARGESLPDAVGHAKHYITGAIAHARGIGKGRGPTHHFYDLYLRAGLEA